MTYYVLTTDKGYDTDVFYNYAEAKAYAKSMKAKAWKGSVFILTGKKNATKTAEVV